MFMKFYLYAMLKDFVLIAADFTLMRTRGLCESIPSGTNYHSRGLVRLASECYHCVIILHLYHLHHITQIAQPM